MKRTTWVFVAVGVVVAIALAAFASPFASKSPDGLNRVAIDKGFADSQKAGHQGPLAGYGVKGVQDQGISKGLAGVVGVIVTFVVALGLFVWLRPRRPTEDASSPEPPTTT